MPRVEFDALPDDARLWIFAASRALTSVEQGHLLAAVDTFIDRWAAHGAPLRAARDWRADRFLLVGVDERAAGVSGCSIDALTGVLKELERRLDVALLDREPVYFRTVEDEGIARVSRDEFATMAAEGRVTEATRVFDNTLMKVEDVRSGRWEVPAGQSWHGRVFF